MPTSQVPAFHTGSEVVRKIVLVHGFTQTSSSLSYISNRLTDIAEVLALDLPGHGDAPMPAASNGLTEAARYLGTKGGKALYVGYSMGARVCLRLALDHPELVCGLVLIGATPGISNATERSARQEADLRLSVHIEQVGVADFIDEWLSGPMFCHLTFDQADRVSRLRNSARGLAAALRAFGQGAETSMWDRLGELRTRHIPVLLVAGGLDSKFTKIAYETAAGIGPTAEVAIVENCGHAVPAERPDELVTLIETFLDKVF